MTLVKIEILPALKPNSDGKNESKEKNDTLGLEESDNVE